MKYLKICSRCGKTFFITKKEEQNRKYCSLLCFNKATKKYDGANNPHWKGGKTKLVCQECGKEYERKKKDVKKGSKHCSIKCHNIAIGKKQQGRNHPNWKGGIAERICGNCNIRFRPSTRMAKGKFCSRKCLGEYRSKYLRGENSPSWMGGYIRNRPNWDIIRNKIYKRDGYKCMRCGRTKQELKLLNMDLHAHHIVPFRVNKDNSYNNLITLCNACHRKVETEYYRSLT